MIELITQVISRKHTAKEIAAFPYSQPVPSLRIPFMISPEKKPKSPIVTPKNQYTITGLIKNPIRSPKKPTIKPGNGPNKKPAKKQTKYENVILFVPPTSISMTELTATLSATKIARKEICFAKDMDLKTFVNIEKNLP